MSQIFSQKVYTGGVSGVVTVVTDPALNTVISQAEKFFVQLRAAQTSGTSPQVKLRLQSSCDGVDWTDKGAAIINTSSITVGAVTYLYGNDPGTTPGGGLMRLAIDLLGTSPSTTLDVWLVGRSND